MGLKIVSCDNLRVALWLHTEQDPPAELWTSAIEQLSALKQELRGDVSSLRMLVITDGGAPNALQRSALFTQLLEGKVKSAVVTTVLANRFKRGIATAIFWLNPNFRAFGPDQLDQALAHLDLDGHGERLIEQLREVQRSVAPTKTLPMLSTGG
ncbi:hypothetical protein [Enhygromyxa salina]|nr:hypothetical protein [Enhygromyxa salina]